MITNQHTHEIKKEAFVCTAFSSNYAKHAVADKYFLQVTRVLRARLLFSTTQMRRVICIIFANYLTNYLLGYEKDNYVTSK